jgi:hypothetical protein
VGINPPLPSIGVDHTDTITGSHLHRRKESRKRQVDKSRRSVPAPGRRAASIHARLFGRSALKGAAGYEMLSRHCHQKLIYPVPAVELVKVFVGMENSSPLLCCLAGTQRLSSVSCVKRDPGRD